MTAPREVARATSATCAILGASRRIMASGAPLAQTQAKGCVVGS